MFLPLLSFCRSLHPLPFSRYLLSYRVPGRGPGAEDRMPSREREEQTKTIQTVNVALHVSCPLLNCFQAATGRRGWTLSCLTLKTKGPIYQSAGLKASLTPDCETGPGRDIYSRRSSADLCFWQQVVTILGTVKDRLFLQHRECSQ